MKSCILMYVSLLVAAIIMKSDCSVVPSQQPSNQSTISSAIKHSPSLLKNSTYKPQLRQPPPKVDTAFRERLRRAIGHLQKKAGFSVFSFITESIPEHSIQMEYLKFVKETRDNSTWRGRAIRNVRNTFTSVWTLLQKPGVAKVTKTSHSNFNQTKDESRQVDQANRTVRTDITADTENFATTQSNGQESVEKMPVNAEDLIRWFNLHGEVAKEQDTNEENPKKSYEKRSSEEEDGGEGEEEEETSRADSSFPGLQYPSGIQGPRHGEGVQSPDEANGLEHAVSWGEQNKNHPPLMSSEVKNGGGALSVDTGIATLHTGNIGAAEGTIQNHDGENAYRGFPDGIYEPERSEILPVQGEAYLLFATTAPVPRSVIEHGQRDKQYVRQQNVQQVDPTQKEEKTKAVRAGNPGEELLTGGDHRYRNFISQGYRGSSQGTINGQNLTQLSLMAYKIAKTEKIYSMAAAPCREVSAWMPEVVKRLELELPGFQFYCIDMEEPAGLMEDLMQAYGDISGGFIQSSPEDIEQAIPKNVDLVVSWMGMQRWGIRKSWRFIKGLRRAGARMALFSNNPMSGNNDPSGQTLNIRKSPLLFNQPQRVIGSVSSNDNMQLLLYSMDALRDGF